MDLVLQSPGVIQTLINSYINPDELHPVYTSFNVTLINAESVKFEHLTRNQLSLYNPKILRNVEIVHLDDPMALTELYTFNLKRLHIDNLTASVSELDASSKNELIAVFTHVALTLEELKLYDETNFGFDEDPTDLLTGIMFSRLRRLYLRSLYVITAPGLTSLTFMETTVDITRLDYPNLTEFIAKQCYIVNLSSLTRFALTNLELDSIEVDTGDTISITGLNLTRLVLVNVLIPDNLIFPRSLEHLTVYTREFDVTTIRRLKLKTLELGVEFPMSFGKIRLSALESLDLTGFRLNDTFFLDAPRLTTLKLNTCTITYTSNIQAPILSEVTLTQCESTDFLPESVIDLKLNHVQGRVVKSVKALTNLTSVEVSDTQFKLKWVRHLHLSRLMVNNCDVSTLKYLRNMRSLRELSLANNVTVTDASLEDLAGLHLVILHLYGTSVTEYGLKYLPPTIQKLILTSPD